MDAAAHAPPGNPRAARPEAVDHARLQAELATERSARQELEAELIRVAAAQEVETARQLEAQERAAAALAEAHNAAEEAREEARRVIEARTREMDSALERERAARLQAEQLGEEAMMRAAASHWVSGELDRERAARLESDRLREEAERRSGEAARHMDRALEHIGELQEQLAELRQEDEGESLSAAEQRLLELAEQQRELLSREQARSAQIAEQLERTGRQLTELVDVQRRDRDLATTLRAARSYLEHDRAHADGETPEEAVDGALAEATGQPHATAAGPGAEQAPRAGAGPSATAGVKRSASLNAVLRVSARIARAQTLRGALAPSLAVLGEELAWDALVAWRPGSGGALACAQAWVRADAELDAFESASWRARLDFDARLLGRVCRAGEPLWLERLTSDSNSARARAASAAGLTTGVLVPVTHAGQVQGVIEALSREVREPDQQVLAALVVAGRELGLLAHVEDLATTPRWRL